VKIAFHTVLAVIMALGLPAALAAKGATSRINISGGSLDRPVDIRSATVTRQFQIWSGPGTTTCTAARRCVEGRDGFIVDWSAGPVGAKPDGLQRYQIAFFVQEDGVAGQQAPEQLAYVVVYEYDPAHNQGFVYLPGKDDPWHELNWGSIYRGGLAGWFHATHAWQDAVVPLISQR
jgi:hypothetical protein